MTVRVGVVGAGVMGADHVTTLHRWVSGAEVTLVADVDLARAERVSAVVPGARATGDPPPPSGIPPEEALVGPDGTPLVPVGFMRRFDPGYTELRARIPSGDCGTPLLVHCVSRGVSSAPGASSASSITGSAVHELDVLPWLLGSPVTDVAWHAPRPAFPADVLRDPQLLLVRTADGVLSTVEVFLNARYGYDIRCEVVGTDGALTLAEPVRLVTDRARARAASYASDWRPRFADAYRLELQAWVDAVRTGSPGPLPTARDGLVAAAVSEAAIASMAAEGRPVPVADPGGASR